MIKRNVEEIAGDRALRYYGAALALVNTLTGTFWLVAQPIDLILAPHTAPICWPIFTECYQWRILSADGIAIVVGVIALAGIVDAWLFLIPGQAQIAFLGLVCLTVAKLVLIVQDYRLVLNQHYMATWVTLVYLFVPSKRSVLRCLIVLFYVWAGSLKFTPEWTSGAGLYGRRPLNLPTALVPAACVYVIVLEVLVAPLALAQRAILFWGAYGQLLLFHVASFWVVGFFYPVLMFLLLAIFPLARYMSTASRGSTGDGSASSVTRLREPATSYVVLIGFSLLQLVPRTLSHSPAVTGEGRLVALNMFDAPLQCRGQANVRTTGVPSQVMRLSAPYVNPRIACDPIVFLELARAHCRSNVASRSFDDLDLTLDTKRFGEAEFRPVFSIPSFCSAGIEYSVWRHNDWISYGASSRER